MEYIPLRWLKGSWICSIPGDKSVLLQEIHNINHHYPNILYYTSPKKNMENNYHIPCPWHPCVLHVVFSTWLFQVDLLPPQLVFPNIPSQIQLPIQLLWHHMFHIKALFKLPIFSFFSKPFHNSNWIINTPRLSPNVRLLDRWVLT